MNAHAPRRSATLDWWQVVAIALLVLGLGSLGLAIGGAGRADAATPVGTLTSQPAEGSS